MTTTDTRFLSAAKRQMPTLWADHSATVQQYLHHSGGGCMNLQRVLDDQSGAHVTLVQEGDEFYGWAYSDDGEECEGHEIVVTDSDSDAVSWFLTADAPAPCLCLAQDA
jgi:hypothetical protein